MTVPANYGTEYDINKDWGELYRCNCKGTSEVAACFFKCLSLSGHSGVLVVTRLDYWSLFTCT